jgi:Uncharacterised nucleotidyltransferase
MSCEPSLPEDSEQAIYADGLRALVAGSVRFLVGGGWALFDYLGRWRNTKDIDVFIAESDVGRALAVLASAGFAVELTDDTWLAKARKNGALIDIIFCSYNGLFPVDESWFVNARDAIVLGVPVRVVGPEEMIVSKCFVAARDRFDGGDVSALIRELGRRQLDWLRVETLMRDHWQVLLWQLVHFVYVHPSERRAVPAALMARLLGRMRRELAGAVDDTAESRGRLLDPKLYRMLEAGLALKRRAGG